jgi:acetoin utilization deacetylase AcuC-like enzyme
MMEQSAKIQVVSDPRYQDHRGPDGHPERPERLVAVSRALDGFETVIDHRAPRAAEPDEILRVHEREHWSRIQETAGIDGVRLDPDTYACRDSFEVARLAAGGTIDLARSVANGDTSCGLAAVRPPGHHAENDRAMGFCLFNNVAIAARAVQADCGVGKILILDWDVHHGNGTQHTFEDDPSVLYFSTHQFPYYPGTGDFGETGTGRGEGTTVNVPLPAGCGDTEYVGVLRRILAPIARQFAPELILVSCGFDAHRDDPLASMDVSAAGYRTMTRIVRSLADELCESRLVFVLEGGYAASSLIEGTTAVVSEMTSQTPADEEENSTLAAGSMLRFAVDQVAAVHASRYRDLGAL